MVSAGKAGLCLQSKAMDEGGVRRSMRTLALTLLLRTSGERGLNWLAIRITDDVRAHPDKPDAAETLYKVIMAAAMNQWSYPPDYKLPRPGLQSAYEMLSIRYKRSVWYQKIENTDEWMGWLSDIKRN